MLAPYDFFVITGLKLGGKRIEGYDAISPTEVKDHLGVNPPRVNGDNVSLTWHFINIEKYRRVDTDTRMFMFMLLLIWNLLCPNLGSTMSLRYLWSLRDVDRIGIMIGVAWLMLGLSKPIQRPNPPKETDWIRSNPGLPNIFDSQWRAFTTRNSLRQVGFNSLPQKYEKPKPTNVLRISSGKFLDSSEKYPDFGKKFLDPD